MKAGTRHLAATLVGLSLATIALPAFANSFLPPMAVLMAVPMWLSLSIVIPLEAVVAKRYLPIDWRACFKLSSYANLASTFVGVPVSYVFFLMAEVVVARPLQGLDQSSSVPYRHAIQAIQLVMQSTWLVGGNDASNEWAAWAAALLLCVPFFFITVLTEAAVARKMVQPEFKDLATKWAWRANILSYIVIVSVIVAFLTKTAFESYSGAHGKDQGAEQLVWPIDADN